MGLKDSVRGCTRFGMSMEVVDNNVGVRFIGRVYRDCLSIKSIVSTLVCGLQQSRVPTVSNSLFVYDVSCAVLLFVLLCWLCIKALRFAGLANKSDALKVALIEKISSLSA